MLNKRGQSGGGDTSLGMIISIVLLVLVLILAGFAVTQSGRDFLAKVFNFGGGTTLDSVVTGCALSADSQATDSFCSELKNVNLDGKSQYVTCAYLNSIGKLDKSLVCPSSQNSQLANKCLALKKTGILVNGITIVSVDNCVREVGGYSGADSPSVCTAFVASSNDKIVGEMHKTKECTDMKGVPDAAGVLTGKKGEVLYNIPNSGTLTDQVCCKVTSL